MNPLDIHLLYSPMDSLRNFIRRLQEKFQKMSRTTWLRLQVWKQRQWCLVKVLYFHTWTHFNLQLSFILYPGWRAADCQRSAVLLWLQLWGQTPLIWENWIWATTSPAGLRSEGAVWFSTESNLSTGDSEVSSLTDFCRSLIYKTAFIHNLSYDSNLT